MNAVRIGLDIAKSVFQVHGVDGHGHRVLRKTLSRAEVLPFFANLAPCLVGVEACAGSHYWAREYQVAFWAICCGFHELGRESSIEEKRAILKSDLDCLYIEAQLR